MPAPSFRSEYRPKVQRTQNGPLKWVYDYNMASGTLGAFGKKVVRAFLAENGFTITPYKGRGVDFIVNGRLAVAKTSKLWDGGIYKFQQIRKDQQNRKDDYELIFFLGVSPAAVNIWVASKHEIVWKDLTGQHGGQHVNSNTWWITCVPSKASYAWMYPQNGNPSVICKRLRRMLK